MNKILIIEPHRMLQQAMMLALAPEYAVRVSTTVDPAALGAFDAVIIDVTALREVEGAAEQQLTLMQSWRGPTVVIDEMDSADGKGRAIAYIKAPITREALKNALAAVLPSASGPIDGGDSVKPGGAPAAAESRPAEEKTKLASADADKAPVIELVDIVEEKS